MLYTTDLLTCIDYVHSGSVVASIRMVYEPDRIR